MPRLFAKLRAAMLEHGDTAKDVANVLLIGTANVSLKLCGKAPWHLDEMYALMDRYHIPYERMAEYFPKGGVHTVC